MNSAGYHYDDSFYNLKHRVIFERIISVSDFNEIYQWCVSEYRNIGGTYGYKWTFKNRETAEKLYATLVLWYP
jgi:hypothetical protein